MYLLKIKGARNSTLAYHHCSNRTELNELLAIYAALGYTPEQMVVEEVAETKAA
jgi:hypothetical protein